ncbi:MAG: DEAD/DEAH box helicase [Candidatus Peribacteria bacterium]|jgi:ATP-dependent DNA helicase RecG|nr:DEAD/DEAH box helicase [Candidatus Peribacteria bacterium]
MQGIKPGRFAQKVWNNLDRIPEIFSEYLPEEFMQQFGLLDVVETMKNLHYPENEEMKKKALHRLFFDRLLRIQLFSLMNKLEYQGSLETPPLQETPHWEILKPILDQLSFSLTVAQKKVIVQILEDFYRGKPMLRLLQGDVGSGKTIVATIAMWYVWKTFGGQSVLLAPLEVLANQHYKTLAKLLLPLGLRVELLTGSLTKGRKEEIKR